MKLFESFLMLGLSGITFFIVSFFVSFLNKELALLLNGIGIGYILVCITFASLAGYIEYPTSKRVK